MGRVREKKGGKKKVVSLRGCGRVPALFLCLLPGLQHVISRLASFLCACHCNSFPTHSPVLLRPCVCTATSVVPQIKAHPWAKVFSKRMPADAVELVSAACQSVLLALLLGLASQGLAASSEGRLFQLGCACTVLGQGRRHSLKLTGPIQARAREPKREQVAAWQLCCSWQAPSAPSAALHTAPQTA